MMKQGIFIKVKGKVTGVYFREHVRIFANEISVTGFAQNTNNGNVIVHAEGEPKQLQKLIRFIENNPGESKVKSINVTPVMVLKNYKRFRRVQSIFEE